jgi:hypothetical protein
VIRYRIEIFENQAWHPLPSTFNADYELATIQEVAASLPTIHPVRVTQVEITTSETVSVLWSSETAPEPEKA